MEKDYDTEKYRTQSVVKTENTMIGTEGKVKIKHEGKKFRGKHNDIDNYAGYTQQVQPLVADSIYKFTISEKPLFDVNQEQMENGFEPYHVIATRQ